jgi:alpha-tubulin suppressor-like RCC1 family protein
MSMTGVRSMFAAAVLTLAMSTATTPPSEAAATNRLSVVIQGLPRGTGGSVTVTGPLGYHRTLTRSETLRHLAPGRYQVKTSAVRVRGHWAKAKASPTSLTLKQGKDGHVVVTYSMRWISLSSGHRHTCGVRIDGTAWCWGWAGYGELGNAKNVGKETVPVQVGHAHNWASVTSGTFHTCGVRTDASAWCWGYNADGQLGNGSHTDATKPVPVQGAAGWSLLSAGYAHTCGLRNDGTVMCWGSNGYGQLGTGGSPAESTTPVQVSGSQHWTSISAGYADTCALDSSGGAWCWGSGIPILGIGNNIPSPFQLAGTWTSVSTSYAAICGIHTDHTVACQGPLPGHAVGDDWRTVAPGYYHACGIRSDRSVQCWGSGEEGELGNGAAGYADSPVNVHSNGRWTALTTGDYQTCGIQTDGSAWCWGVNDYGQLGDGSSENANVPVPVSG